ncbi:antitoxin VbhA family protein [Zhongshania aliphaticivorans]
MAISGHRVSDELRAQMTRIINGEVTADEVRQDIFLRYRKPDIS